MKTDFIHTLLRATLVPTLLRELVQRRRPTIVLYHDPSPEVADQHFAALKARYTIIPLRQLVDARRDGTVDKLPKKSLVITFDDGHRRNHDLLPVIRAHGVPCTIFLCSRIVDTGRRFWFLHDKLGARMQELKRLPDERRLEVLRELGFDEQREYGDRQALSRGEIDEMKAEVDFQAHTMYHPILPRCSDERARREIFESKKDLEQMGLEPYALSYPNGDYSDREIALAKEAGFDCAITVDLGFNSNTTDVFRMKRICIPDDAGMDSLLVRTSGLWDWLRQLVKRRARGHQSGAE